MTDQTGPDVALLAAMMRGIAADARREATFLCPQGIADPAEISRTDHIAAGALRAYADRLDVRADRMQHTGITDKGALPAEVIALIEDLTGDEPCRPDHHGYCHEHLWFETVPTCPHARARQLLADNNQEGGCDA